MVLRRKNSSRPRNHLRIAGATSSSMIGPIVMPPTTTVASGFCTWLPMPVEIAAGNSPTPADSAVISIGRMRCSEPWKTASRCPCPGSQFAVIGDVQDAVHHRYAKQRDEADRRRNREIQARDIERDDAATNGERNAGHGEQAIAQRVEQAIEQHQDQRESDRHDDGQSPLGLLQILEFAGPEDVIAGRAA